MLVVSTIKERRLLVFTLRCADIIVNIVGDW